MTKLKRLRPSMIVSQIAKPENLLCTCFMVIASNEIAGRLTEKVRSAEKLLFELNWRSNCVILQQNL